MKKTTKLTLITTSVLAMCVQVASAQDIHFSQFYNAPLQVNPANSGAFNGDERGIVNYRNQWKSPTVNSPFKTMAASFDMPFLKKKWKNDFLGFGLFMYSDKAGDSKMGTAQVNLSVANHLKVNKNNMFSVALQAGFAQKSVSAANLKWGDTYVDGNTWNPTSDRAAKNVGKGYADFSVGGLWTYSKREGFSTSNNSFKFNIGASYNHLTKPDAGFYRTDNVNQKLMVNVNAVFGVPNSNLAILPSVFYQMQGPNSEILPGALLRYSLIESSKYTGRKKETALSVGGHYRLKDSFIAAVLLEYSNYAMGISYDVNTSDLRTASSFKGGFELSLRYINPNPFRSVSSARFD